MAKHARTIREIINYILKDDGNGNPLVDDRQKSLPMFHELYGLYCKIKGDLQPAMTARDFADMYAQTIVYGLFIARYNDKTPDSFDRYEAIKYLQEESDLLKQFFMHIAGSGKINSKLESVIDRLCALYRICSISDLLGHDEQKDLIIHFYETFLTYYDPALRKSLGVFYTPVQAVRYLVSKVDHILVEDFHIRGGLSNDELLTTTVPSATNSTLNAAWGKKEEISVPRVAILDPACGTGSFGAEIIKYVKNTHYTGSREAFYRGTIQSKTGLLSRLIGFEIMMTSYVVARLKIRRTIDETLGQASDVRMPINVFLTNTLAPPHSIFERSEQTRLFDFSDAITQEAYQADTWKTRRPIKVIIGNPPYLAASTNLYDISAYRMEPDGITKLQEKNPKWLGDDYVKFFYFAQEIIERVGEGILAYVSPHGYLDNPTFRGMRASLLRAFDKIFIINLHGNSNRNETAPDGGIDENIFDIKQGIALFIGVKTTKSSTWAAVKYTDLWGTRINKLKALSSATLDFIDLSPDTKMAYLIPKNIGTQSTYEQGIGVNEIMTSFTSGIVSGNDNYAFAATKEEISKRIERVKNATEQELSNFWGKYGSGQTAERIISDVLNSNGVVTQIAFRPFDSKWTYYSGTSCGWIVRPREKKIMGAFIVAPTSPIGENIGLVTARSNKSDSCDHFFVSKYITEAKYGERTTQSAIFPLYLYNELDNSWSSNLDTDALARLTAHMTSQPSPIEVFDYIYGILYDPFYRERFREFLKRDFPRVPVINVPEDHDNSDLFHVSEDMFHAYVVAGERLRKLHLMQVEVPVEGGLVIEPNTPSDMEIGSIAYKDGVLYLNANKRILGVTEDVWNYHVGGYQILDKWFKSHKGELLTRDSFTHIENIVYILTETIKVQEDLKGLHKR